MSRHEKLILMDKYKRKLFLKFFIKRLLLKSIKNCLLTSNSKRYLAYMYLIRNPRFTSSSAITNRCIKTGRVWSVNKKTNLSRFELRTHIYNSILPGFRRASW